MASISEISSRFLTFLKRYVHRSPTKIKSSSESISRNSHGHGRPERRHGRKKRSQYHVPMALVNRDKQITALDIARFGLLSIATLPFSGWISLYAWNYFQRVSICEHALAEEDNEISFLRSKSVALAKKKTNRATLNDKDDSSNEEGSFFGRDRPLAEVRNLLAKPPHQILVVAGTNESGKSRFVAEVLRALPLSRGVTYIQLAQLVDSLSTFTHAFVRSFDLRWLQMRHALVDVLPFAGSEILVMKERFSSRDLNQSLQVITEALKAKKKADPYRALPVLLIDGLGEASGAESSNSTWIRSPEGRRTVERLIQWCIYVTKERQLAHVVLTGNEELVFSLTNQNRTTRGHVKVIGLADLSPGDATKLIREELPDVTDAEVDKILYKFGGFIHDIRAVSREIRSKLHHANNKRSNTTEASDPITAKNDPNNPTILRQRIVDEVISRRFKLQIERVSAAFAKGRDEEDTENSSTSEETDDDDDMDPYLDPLKAVYSEAQASQLDVSDSSPGEDDVCWSQVQLWNTIKKLVDSETMTVSFADLRDEIFNGDTTPLLELMNEDVLGFEVENTSDSAGWSWEVKPATPALARVFQHLVNSSFKERFREIEQMTEKREKIQKIEMERRQLRLERRRLEMRKASLAKTIQVGRSLGLGEDSDANARHEEIYNSIVLEEAASEKRGEELRRELTMLSEAETETTNSKDSNGSPTKNLSDHLSIQRRLKHAVLEAFGLDDNRDKFSRFRDAIAKLSSNGSGITADDVVRIIKATSGEDIDPKAAGSFIRFWDKNNDTQLEYDEFVQMLLADDSSGLHKDDHNVSAVQNLDDL